MTDATEAEKLYRAHFTRLEKELSSNGQSWTLPLRKAAISYFSELGFPTPRHEEWRYTNVAPVAQTPFQPAGREPGRLTSEALARVPFGTLVENRVVFINGHYAPGLSSLLSLPKGVKVCNLAEALSAEPERVKARLAQYANYRDQPFVALNTAFMEDGAFVYVPKGEVVEEPMHLLFISTAPERPTVSYPRSLILVDSDAHARIVESYVGLEGGVYFTNAVTELVVGENAVVDHYKLQEESEEAFHIASLQADVGRSGNFSSHSIAVGGALVRNEVNAVLDGEGCECTLNGLYLVGGRQHVDNHTRIDHVKPHGTSREIYKGVLGGRARGVFNGKIVVHQSAPKTDARQTNNNLLLSRDALVDTKPQLEISNNDVKCTHGSTIGQLDQDAIFYLCSRGIGMEAARSLLTYAFASDITNRLKIDALRAQLDDLLMTRFQKNLETRET